MTQAHDGNATGSAAVLGEDDAQIHYAHEQLRHLRAAMSQAVIGQANVVDEIIVGLIAAGHVLVEGVPGVGKTLMVRALAQAVRSRFGRIQFTPDLMPSDVTGHTLYDVASGQFRLRRGPIFCNLLLADEINRAPAKTQAALLEVMQEQQVTIDGESLALASPFMVIATQNPIEQEGTYPLPEAQVDRFLLKVRVDYPSHEDEASMVNAVTHGRVGDRLVVDQVTPILEPEDVLRLQTLASRLKVDPAVSDYAVRIARATRVQHGIYVGAGPRAGIALVRAARAHALLNGHSFTTPDDVKIVALPALRHRVALSPDMELEGYSVDRVLETMLQEVEAPRL